MFHIILLLHILVVVYIHLYFPHLNEVPAFYRMTESLKLEGTFRDCLVKQENPEQVAEDQLISTGGGLHSLSKQHFPLFHSQ